MPIPTILSAPYYALNGNLPVPGVLLGGDPGANAGAGPGTAPPEDGSVRPAILRGPYYPLTADAPVQEILLGGLGGLGGPINNTPAVVAPPVVIVQDGFSGANGTPIDGTTPDGADLPGGEWIADIDWTGGSAAAQIDTAAGNPAPCLALPVTGTAPGASAAISVASAGSYGKPSMIRIQADFNLAALATGLPVYIVGVAANQMIWLTPAPVGLVGSWSIGSMPPGLTWATNGGDASTAGSIQVTGTPTATGSWNISFSGTCIDDFTGTPVAISGEFNITVGAAANGAMLGFYPALTIVLATVNEYADSTDDYGATGGFRDPATTPVPVERFTATYVNPFPWPATATFVGSDINDVLMVNGVAVETGSFTYFGTTYPYTGDHAATVSWSVPANGSFTMGVGNNVDSGSGFNGTLTLTVPGVWAGSTGGMDPLTGFTGLVLQGDGSVVLVENGTPSPSIAYTGRFPADGWVTLSYVVDTATGGISSVALTGSRSVYDLSTSAFTDAATAFAALGLENGAAASQTLLADNFLVTAPAGVGAPLDDPSAVPEILFGPYPVNSLTPIRSIKLPFPTAAASAASTASA